MTIEKISLVHRQSPTANSARFLDSGFLEKSSLVIRQLFLMSHTSATWHPRPLPPNLGVRCQLNVSSPSAVACGGISNPTGRIGDAGLVYGWSSYVSSA